MPKDIERERTRYVIHPCCSILVGCITFFRESFSINCSGTPVLLEKSLEIHLDTIGRDDSWPICLYSTMDSVGFVKSKMSFRLSGTTCII